MRYFFEKNVYSDRLKTTFLIITIPFLTLLAFKDSTAKTINANSGSPEDVQSAINSASTGDIVLIPSGDFRFDDTVNLPGGISIQGTGEGQTTLRRTKEGGFMFIVDCSNQNPLTRITGLTLIGIATTRADPKGSGIKLINDCQDFRVDNNTFKNLLSTAIDVRGVLPRGVIDNNNFIGNPRYGITVVGAGDDSWSLPLTLGTENAVFIEDNYFEGGLWHDIASNNGSRYVARYNITKIFEDNGNQSIDAHGFSSWERGSRSYEIYENKIIVEQGAKRGRGIHVRGGDGVIFNNEFTGNFGFSIGFKNDEANNGVGDNCNYPCKDQIRALYIWNNTTNSGPADIVNAHPTIIKQNRDYYFIQKPNYSPYIYPHPLASGSDLGLRIITNAVPNMIVGTAYSANFLAIGGQEPYQWQIVSGTLPQGIELNDNVISGTTDDNEGNYSFTVRVTDDKNDTASQEFVLEVFSGIFSIIPYFGDIANWESSPPNYWATAEKDGDKRFIITSSQLNSSGNKLAAYSLVKDRAYGDFAMTFNVKSPESLPDNPGADFTAVFGYQDDNNYYYMLFNNNASWSVLHKIENGSRSEIMSASMALITDNDYHKIEVSRQGTLITVRRNEVIVLSANDATFGTGKVGIGSLNDAAYFDDIDVKIGIGDNQPPEPPKSLNVLEN